MNMNELLLINFSLIFFRFPFPCLVCLYPRFHRSPKKRSAPRHSHPGSCAGGGRGACDPVSPRSRTALARQANRAAASTASTSSESNASTRSTPGPPPPVSPSTPSLSDRRGGEGELWDQSITASRGGGQNQFRTVKKIRHPSEG